MRQLQLRKIGVRNLQRWWMPPLVVVEMLGGLELSRRLILRAIAMGKPVVTANKAVIAHHGVEINAAAAQAGVSVLMEAAVGGGIPIIDPLKQSLGANRIQVMGTERNSGKPGPRLDTGRVQSVKRTTEVIYVSAMALQLGDTVPDFTQNSQQGPINLYDFAGDSWVVLFSHPADYTPVCTTELGEVAKLRAEWDKRNVKTIALSVDSATSHTGWVGDINETQSTTVDYPILADEDKTVSDLYGMVHPNASNTLTVRSVFIIDPAKKLRLQITYPASTGRNFDEILRVIDSLQLTDNHSVATPVNWKDGDDCVVVPAISTEDAKVKFSKGVTEIKPYLRMTPQPNK